MSDMDAYLCILNPICEKIQRKQNMANKKENEEFDSDVKIEWDSNEEMLLLYAMLGLKPVGVNRHFMMMCIHRRFSTLLKKEIPSKLIWDHLESFYDMAALHESEIIPFPNDEVDYELPLNMVGEEPKAETEDLDDGSEDSKSDSNFKSAKKTSTSKSKQNSTPVSNSKNVFLTPVSGKLTKQVLSKSESKPPGVSENSSKVKQESPFSTKLTKVKRSSSPFPAKNSKTEQSSSVHKEESSDPPPTKKIKLENSTPASSKKTPKSESNSSSKKYVKQDQNAGSKHKAETPHSSKKVKTEKDSNKKSRGTSGEGSTSKKYSKSDRKADDEVLKKLGDSSGKPKMESRSSSVSSKGTKHEDSDSSFTSGSRKSSPVVKLDFSKKKKGSPMKRRRT